nr:MFS transporter [Plastoroseomonas hellenica]
MAGPACRRTAGSPLAQPGATPARHSAVRPSRRGPAPLPVAATQVDAALRPFHALCVPRPADLSILPWLSAAAFAAGCGMRLLDPLLPMVAGDFGTTVGAASTVIAAFALAYGAGQVVVGPVGDRQGKLRVVWLALLLYGLCTAACALAWSLGAMVALRVLTGAVAGAIIPVSIAWIGDNVPYQDRQAMLGRFLTGMVLAQLLAGPVSGVVGEHFGWRASFLVLGVMALVVALALALRLGGALWRKPERAEGGGGVAGYYAILRRRTGRRLLAAAFIDGFCLFGGAFPFIGAYLIERFHLSAAEAGFVVAGFGIGAFAYTRLARWLIGRFGERGLILIGGVALFGLLGAMAVAPVWWVVAGLQVPAGLAFFAFHGVLQTRATEALPEARATAVSAFAMALFFGQSLGSLGFGLVIGLAGYGAGLGLAALVVLALAIWTQRVLFARPAG